MISCGAGVVKLSMSMYEMDVFLLGIAGEFPTLTCMADPSGHTEKPFLRIVSAIVVETSTSITILNFIIIP